MRAAVLDGTGTDHLAVRRVPVPRPGPGQLLARVDAAGICTSVNKLLDQGPAHPLMHGWDPAAHPVIVGDEGVVTLVEVGADLRDQYRPGMRMAVQPAVDIAPIQHLERYRDQGRGVAKIAVGYTLPGLLAEYVLIGEEVLAAGCLLPLPDAALPAAHAAIAEPISCIISSHAHHVHLDAARSHAAAPREQRPAAGWGRGRHRRRAHGPHPRGHRPGRPTAGHHRHGSPSRPPRLAAPHLRRARPATRRAPGAGGHDAGGPGVGHRPPQRGARR